MDHEARKRNFLISIKGRKWQESYGDEEVAEEVEYLLQQLTMRERDISELRWGLLDGNPRSIEEVGKNYGIARERVRQIEIRAYEKLRNN